MGLGPYKAVSSIQQFSVAPLPMPSPGEGYKAAGRKGFLLPVNFFFALIPEATVSPYRSSAIQLSVFPALIKAILWAGEMAQRLRALPALPKVLSSITSNHMVAHNHLE